MKRKAFPALIVILGIFLYSNLLLAASPGESGCVKCHTDETKLKSLFVRPKAAPAEGEG